MKPFISLIVVAVVVGAALAGAFLVGMTMGKGTKTEAAVLSLPTPTISTARSTQNTPNSATNVGQVAEGDIERLAALRQKSRSGDLTAAESEEYAALREKIVTQRSGMTPEQLAQLRQQFSGGSDRGSSGGSGWGGGNRRGLRGTIAEIVGGKLTIETSQGPLTATVGSDTTIRLWVDGSLADLTKGTTVTVSGERGEDGGVNASTVTIVPEGALGGASFGRGGSQ